jgi:RimJ/RimL family protein N-acetyltransferase
MTDKRVSKRLILQTLRPEQAATLAQLGDDAVIAANTANMPSPYTEAIARDFIDRATQSGETDQNIVFGIHLVDGTLIGVINIRPHPRHRSGNIGYWIGAPFRGNGYATEAVRAMIDHGFEQLGLQRIHTSCFATNKASARVLEKAGFKPEGQCREAFYKDGIFLDLLLYGLIRADH